jgi:ACT domain-containing protein
MKVDVLLELRDSPGQLSAALGVIGRHGGNVVSVLHEHQKKKADHVPVRIVLDVPREGQQLLLQALSAEFRLLSVAGATTSHSFAFLLLGHVFESQVQEVTDAIFAAGGEVRRFTAEIVSRESPSAALVEISAPDRARLDAARGAVREVATRKGLAYVEALGGDEP